MPDPFPALPPGATAELDQHKAESAALARRLAAHHQALKDQGFSDALADSLTEMHATFIYEHSLHVFGCHDHED